MRICDNVPGTPSFTQQTFRRDMVSGTTIIVSRSNSGVAANGSTNVRGLSRDGRYILFDASANNLATNDNNFSNDVFVRDEQAGITLLVSINRDASGPVTSVIDRSPGAAGCCDQLAGDRPGLFRGQKYRDECDLRGVHHAADGIAARRVGSEVLLFCLLGEYAQLRGAGRE